MRVLVVEDDPILSDGLSVGLRMAGFSPDAVGCIADAETAMRASAYEAVVLDVMLPDGSGIDFLATRRQANDRTPFLILTARDRIPERIEGLDAGADDYLGKPFDLDELAARLRALVRRNAGRATSALTWNDIVLDPATLAVSRAGKEIPLTRREFTILRALMERPGTVLTKPALEETIYGWQEGVESNAVEVHVHHLRSKIGHGVVQTVRGLGYRIGGELP
ncbi:MAG TPA: response regulator transcription factor [Rhizobiaceae bacterium]|nr:response regulator transcription factor [Rhizobiaceae bacterium]